MPNVLGSVKVSADVENTSADGEVVSYEEEVMRSVEATRALVKKAEYKSTLLYAPPLLSSRELSAELESLCAHTEGSWIHLFGRCY